MSFSRWMAIGALVFAICCPQGTRAQSQKEAPAATKVAVGDPKLEGAQLKPYKNAWKVVYAVADKPPFLVGVWTDELAEVEIGGRRLMKRTQTADYAKYHIVTTYVNVFDPKTMAPVEQEFHRSDTGEWAKREFEGKVVKYQRSERADATKTEKGELKLAEAIFDYNGGMYGVFLAALPLREGYKATFPSLSEDRDELEWVTITVGKQELVEAGPGKQVLAWPVDTEANYANKSHSIFWISKEPPYIIQLVTTVEAAKRVTVTLTML
ncbi:MAG TPA: hypothetical protein VLW54_03510 [Candidatus Acidoferrales bacterium]|nr:hypothetical protein [Candidatus Acidoferrales bacterium]